MKLTGQNGSIKISVTTPISTNVKSSGMQGPKGDKGDKGPKGDRGDTGEQGTSLVFNELTESQKLELRGDVGDTSVNYTNIFLNSLLS